MTGDSYARKPIGLFRNLSAKIAAMPMIFTAVVVFLGCSVWTVVYSFTGSRMLPKTRWVGFDQYVRLWETDRWLISVKNLAIYGGCMMLLSLVIGFLLAALLDRKIRGEGVFRTIFLYPYALSFVVTGIAWQWMLDPSLGIQKFVQDLGWTTFQFAPLADPRYAIFGVMMAGLWQGAGLIMALMLAGMRGIDGDIWKAARVDGIPDWKTYIFIVIPMMRGVFVTSVVMISVGVVRVYDLIVAQTQGGPGISTDVPAKYVIDNMFGRLNLGQAFAASTMMLIFVLVILIPWSIYEFGGSKKR